MHPFGRHLLVYLGQAHPDDRVIGFRFDLVLLQEGFHLRHLRLGHVEQEIVRAVRRQLLLPAFEQIAAQHQQQRQQHERQRERRQLADGHPRLMQQAVDRQPQRQTLERDAAQQQQAAPPYTAQQQRQHRHARQDRPQQRAGSHQQHQQRDHDRRRHRQEVAQRPDVGCHIATQHPQRLGGQQLAIRPQPDQQRNQHQRTERPQPRPDAGGGQRGRQHRLQQANQQRLERQPDRPAAHRRQRHHRQPLADDQFAQRAAPGAKGFQHRDQIVAAAAIVAHRHRHGGDRQQQRQQGRQQQELLGALQRLAERAAGLLQPEPALIRRQLRRQPFFVTLNIRLGAGEHVAVGQAAARLHRAGLIDVRQVDHDARRGLEWIETGVRLLNDFTGDAQRGVAHLQRIPHFHVQQRQQTRRHQHAARFGLDVGRARFQLAVQRIGQIGGFHVRQLRPIAGIGHGGERQLTAHLQPLLLRVQQPAFRHRMRAAQHPIAGDKIAALLAEPFVHAIADAAQRQHAGDGERQRQPHDQQRRRAPFAPEPAPDHASSHSLPSRSRSRRWQRAARVSSWVTRIRVVSKSRLRENSRSAMRSPV